jgi:hypothetical protein
LVSDLRASGFQYEEDTGSFFLPLRIDKASLLEAVKEEEIEQCMEPLRTCLRNLEKSVPTFASLMDRASNMLAMTAMALDPAGGGRDSAELARRHGGWYAELISAKGQETADGSATAAMVVRYRLDSAPVIVDVGGGYGGGVTIRLKDNGIEPVSFVCLMGID